MGELRGRRGVLRRLAPPSTRRWRWRDLVTHLVPPERRRRRYLAALPGVLEEVARSLRSGTSIPQALAEVSATGDDPVRVELRQVTDRMASGDDLVRALHWWRRRAADPAVGLPVAALTLAVQGGGSRAWAVDQVAVTFRERLALQAELRAQSSQASLSATVLIVSPFVFAVITALVDPRVLAFLLATPVGWGCLLTGIVLDLAGAWWMARIVRSPW